MTRARKTKPAAPYSQNEATFVALQVMACMVAHSSAEAKHEAARLVEHDRLMTKLLLLDELIAELESDGWYAVAGVIAFAKKRRAGVLREIVQLKKALR